MQVVTRKFLVKGLPDLSKFEKKTYNRFYLYLGENIVIRVQKVGDKYELERKVNKSDLVRDEVKIEITQDEFESLSKMTPNNILRDGYLISEKPIIKLTVYHGRFEGLARAEVTFESEEDSKSFIPFEWFDKEITSSPLAQDGKLLGLNEEEFKRLLIEN